MALSSEPADRCRAASLTMTVLAFITALALMVVGFASPASAQAVPHTNNAVVATVSSQAVAAPAGGVIEVQLRAPASCRKHACRATLSKPAVIVALLANVLARQGQRTVVICTEFASGPAVAGGDPVNGSDPSGDIAAPAQSGDMCLPNPATGTYGSDVCIGQVGMAACVDAVGASYAVNLPGGVNLATEMCSGAFDGVAPGASWSNLVESYDPAYGMLYWAHQAWDVAQDPCSSNWTILEDSLNAFNSADATLLFGLGGADAGGFPDGGPSSLGDTGSLGVPARTPWGWTGTQSYRAAVKLVNQGGDLPDVYGAIPTQAQAEQLINGGGGSVTRIEEGHLEGGNPHSYPHINYRTSTGVRSSLQIITVTQAYP